MMMIIAVMKTDTIDIMSFSLNYDAVGQDYGDGDELCEIGEKQDLRVLKMGQKKSPASLLVLYP